SVNNTAIQLRVAPSIVLGYTFVPLKFVSEALGASVAWDGTSRTVTIMTVKNSGFTEILAQNSNQEFSFQNIAMGDSESKVIEQLGAPGRKDLSEYGFTWYVYNQDYAKYVQVGILSGKVVALYTNSNTWVSKEGIRIGSAKADVTNAYGSNPLVSILKENTLFSLDAGTGVGKEHGTYLLDGSYATIFYDNHKNDTVTAVQIIDKKVEESLLGYFGVPSEQLRISFERQNFDITNSLRVRFGLKPFIWNDAIANTARKHSQDMMNRNYFAHLNLDGDSPFDRMTADGIKYSKAAENIFAGARSAIYAHEGWMNSEGHRHNILSDIQRLGVGVAFGGSYKVYVTQNFYTPL
ncbi:MAG TPA: CAP-associated domain-containing protein, partial [Bacilli bacterium]